MTLEEKRVVFLSHENTQLRSELAATKRQLAELTGYRAAYNVLANNVAATKQQS